jgi:hypothetical protein
MSIASRRRSRFRRSQRSSRAGFPGSGTELDGDLAVDDGGAPAAVGDRDVDDARAVQFLSLSYADERRALDVRVRVIEVAGRDLALAGVGRTGPAPAFVVGADRAALVRHRERRAVEVGPRGRDPAPVVDNDVRDRADRRNCGDRRPELVLGAVDAVRHHTIAATAKKTGKRCPTHGHWRRHAAMAGSSP